MTQHNMIVFLKHLKAFAFGLPLLVKLCELRHKSNKSFNWFVNDFMQQEEQSYIAQYLTNIGFKVHSTSRALVAQTQLPKEVYDAMGGRQNDMEEIDVYGVMEYVMHERMQGVFAQLEKHNLLDIITLKHIYIGNGIICTVMSNLYEAEYQELKEEEPCYTALTGLIVEIAAMICLLVWLC